MGASGIDFFGVPGITDPAAARDYLLLSSLRDALTLLASPAFAAAFHQSADQDGYRWGLLHRLVLAHPLGEPFSVPPGFGQFPAPLPGPTGIPVDGGFETLDAASHHVRAMADSTGSEVNSFMFSSGPARRFVASMAPARSAQYRPCRAARARTREVPSISTCSGLTCPTPATRPCCPPKSRPEASRRGFCWCLGDGTRPADGPVSGKARHGAYAR